MLKKVIVGATVGAVVVLGAYAWYSHPDKTPRQEMCANYTDLLDAARVNGREEIYRNPVFDDLCKNGGL